VLKLNGKRQSKLELSENGHACKPLEKGDASGYKELGAEKSGFNEDGDTWWETWKEVFRQDESSGLAHIERSAGPYTPPLLSST